MQLPILFACPCQRLPYPAQKLERKDRSKSKKAHRAEAAMKLEGITPATVTSTSAPVDIVIPVTHTHSASSSASDISSGGMEADTEESMTSEEEPDKPAGATPDNKEPSKDKWIAVRGQQASSLET